MSVADRFLSLNRRPLLPLLLVFAGTLWIAGGASRVDPLGQAVVRIVAWACLIIMILFGTGRPTVRRGRVVLGFLGVAAVLAAIQLVPLPPELWSRLPGRAAFATATAFAGDPAPWRPLTIVPGATANALGSLIVPFVVFCFAAGGIRADAPIGAEIKAAADPQVSDGALVKILLGLVVGCLFVGLLQFAGASIYDPLVNRGDDVVGTFANRNHFALMMACGLLLAPAWAFMGGRRPGWRGSVVIALIPLLALAILASGSRTGMLVGLVALGCGIAIVRQPLRRALGRGPRWVAPVLIAGLVAVLGGLVTLGVATDRALSINRALLLDPGRDMRSRALPTVLEMTAEYFPVGSGLGGFDPVFRMHEPFDLLKPSYFNRAHNDFLEIVLDTGVIGLALLLAAMGWWMWMSVRAWRAPSKIREEVAGRIIGDAVILPRLGSAILGIIALASIVDYPARTPMIMAVVVIAAVWLSTAASIRPSRVRGSPLPPNVQPL
ncbi:MAG TPA: O-antigen ligase family protein [Sphingomonas sp.]|jgi:O-antigen ligase